MLSGLFSPSVRRVVVDALGRAGAYGSALAGATDGRLAVIGRADVGRAVRDLFPALSVEVVKLRGGAVPGALTPRSFLAVVAPEPDAPEALAALLEILVDGGVIVLIGHGDRRRSAGLALCAGLALIEQRRAGRSHVTSGVWDAPSFLR